MELSAFFASQSDGKKPLGEADVDLLCGAFRTSSARRGAVLARQGEANDREYVLLTGRAVALARDADGRETCLGLYSAPCPIAPNFVRGAGGVSLVTLDVLDDAQLADTAASVLMALMTDSAGIRDWGNGVAQAEMQRKAGREWCLAVLPARERLDWFRQTYPGLEDAFPHRYIASFLGITPVTLSRARNG